MEKNVGSVDLEELKQARHELNEMRGIKDDPNMYSNYDPNREESHESSTDGSETDENKQNFQSKTLEAETSNNLEDEPGYEGKNMKVADETFGDKDFSVYDNFASFEVGSNSSNKVEDKPLNEQHEEKVEKDSSVENAHDNQAENEKIKTDYTDNFAMLDDNKENTDDHKVENDSNENGLAKDGQTSGLNLDLYSVGPINFNDEKKEIDKNVETSGANVEKNEPIDNFATFERNEMQESEKVESDSSNENVEAENETSQNVLAPEDSANKKIEDENATDTVKLAVEHSDTDDLEQLLKKGGLGNLLKDDEVESKSHAQDTKQDEEEVEKVEEVDDGDAKGLKERMSDLRKKNQISNFVNEKTESEGLDTEEKEPELLPKINDFEFIDLISSDEFKDNGSLTFLLGKDEDNGDLYLSLKDTLNIGIFGKNSRESNDFLNSIILSMMLKNNPNDFNIILCDPSSTSNLNIYEDSKYMFYSRIARTQKEIFDVLSDISAEIEERYTKISMIDAKSIDGYNELVREDFKLPYVLIVYNNYSDLASNDYYDEINIMLYNILKLGRLVGIYVALQSENPPTNSNVNYNLSTRISFKAETKDESISRLGKEGAELLGADDEVLWVSIANERVIHAKVPKIKLSEAKILLQNIENTEN